jgi:hypothetical protein
MTRAILEHAVEPLLLIGAVAALFWAGDRLGDRFRQPDVIAADNPPDYWWGFPLMLLYLVGLVYGLALLPEVVR